jgi:hypothetical protein
LIGFALLQVNRFSHRFIPDLWPFKNVRQISERAGINLEDRMSTKLVREGLCIGAALALISCATQNPYPYGGVTDDEIYAVTPLVRERSKKRIVSYKREPDGTIRVQTESQELFRIRKMDKQWKVIESVLITY